MLLFATLIRFKFQAVSVQSVVGRCFVCVNMETRLAVSDRHFKD